MLSMILMAALGAVYDTPASVAPGAAAPRPCAACNGAYQGYYGASVSNSYYDHAQFYGAPQAGFMGGCNGYTCPSNGDVDLFFPCPPLYPCAPPIPAPPRVPVVRTYPCPTLPQSCPRLPPAPCP